MEYPTIECACGEHARIVECTVGVYIHCPYCNAGTPMAWSKEMAIKEWKEQCDEKCK